MASYNTLFGDIIVKISDFLFDWDKIKLSVLNKKHFLISRRFVYRRRYIDICLMPVEFNISKVCVNNDFGLVKLLAVPIPSTITHLKINTRALIDSYTIPVTITHLTITSNWIYSPETIFPPNISSVKLKGFCESSCVFDLDKLPKTLTKLNISIWNTTPIRDKTFPNLTHLEIWNIEKFVKVPMNKYILSFPQNLTTLISKNYLFPMRPNLFPKNLTRLVWNMANDKLTERILPTNLSFLTLICYPGCVFDGDVFPKSVTRLEIDGYQLPLTVDLMPPKLTELKISKKYAFLNNLNPIKNIVRFNNW